MTKLEEANLATQLELLTDIKSNQQSINYEIIQNAKLGVELLKERKFLPDGAGVKLKPETFEKIWDILFVISEPNKWYQLGILSKEYVPDNEMKLKILQKLQS